MRLSSHALRLRVILALLASILVAEGCSRSKHRIAADREAYDVIAERNCDPRWSEPGLSIDVDPRSRYFDCYDPDYSPMPPDDPVSHQYMVCVDGRKGWKHWQDNGHRLELENPSWEQTLPGYVEMTEDGKIRLSVDSAVRLAYIHSPFHQTQLETLYLSALDVTAERFRLDTQFFGGYNANYLHQGSLLPPRLTYNSTFGRYVVTPAVDGVESNLATMGRPSSANPALQARKRFATAGELLVGFANSFVFEFTGSDANLAASLANFSFIQPLLRGAGRDIALEQLTREERTLLANLRAYSQFRQGFYTQVAIGELGVTGPRRSGAGTTLQSFGGIGGVGGYLGLLQQVQQIRNAKDNLSLQRRTRARLEALLANDLTTLFQVDLFRQSVQAAEAGLLRQENSLELELDRYKTVTLGLPPGLPVDLDVNLIAQFELVPREASGIQDSTVTLQREVATWPDEPAVEIIAAAMDEAQQLVSPLQKLSDSAKEDLERFEKVVPKRERTMSAEDRLALRDEGVELRRKQSDVKRDFAKSVAELNALQTGLTDKTIAETARKFTSWVAEFLQITERMVLVPARARLQLVTVDPLEMESDYALQIALTNRLDFMNGRAALVDQWRLIQVSADALQSVVDVTAAGDIRTARNNALSFRAPTSTMRMGLEFDAPLTRLLERNAYRETLIEYQRSRRSFIQSCDSLHLGLRALLRQIERLRKDLEIQRRAVAIAIRQVDQTLLDFNPPRIAPQPGERPAINPTKARDLVNAQNSLRSTQDSFLNAWLSYHAAQMRLYRELGIMELDQDGRWMEIPLPGSNRSLSPDGEDLEFEELPAPPSIPAGWIELVNYAERLRESSEIGEEPAHVSQAIKVDRIPLHQPLTEAAGSPVHNEK